MKKILLTGEVGIGKSTALRTYIAGGNLRAAGLVTAFAPAGDDGFEYLYLLPWTDAPLDAAKAAAERGELPAGARSRTIMLQENTYPATDAHKNGFCDCTQVSTQAGASRLRATGDCRPYGLDGRNDDEAAPRRSHKRFPEVFDSLGVQLLRDAASAVKARAADLIVVDELGFMERDAALFRKTVMDLLDTQDLPLVGVVKEKPSPFTDAIKLHSNVVLVDVTLSSREDVPKAIEKLYSSLLFHQHTDSR